jgi:hypothetical protein
LKKKNKMAIINKIKEMRSQGFQEPQIAQRLREEGVSPREIDEALDQSNVKSAVANYEDFSSPQIPPPQYPREAAQDFSQQNASLGPTFNPQFAEHPNQDQIDFEEQQIFTSSSGPPQQSFQQEQGAYGQGQYQQEQFQQEQGVPGQEQYQQPAGGNEQYPQYEYNSAPQQGTDTITELTEQIVEEKTQEMQKQITEFSQFKLESQGKIENIEDRLRRIELIIDKLQASIIGQIGNYGKNISDLKKEMIATQESFSKIVNPLTSSIQDLREITSNIPRTAEAPEIKKTQDNVSKKPNPKKSKYNFEGYLR